VAGFKVLLLPFQIINHFNFLKVSKHLNKFDLSLTAPDPDLLLANPGYLPHIVASRRAQMQPHYMPKRRNSVGGEGDLSHCTKTPISHVVPREASRGVDPSCHAVEAARRIDGGTVRTMSKKNWGRWRETGWQGGLVGDGLYVLGT